MSGNGKSRQPVGHFKGYVLGVDRKNEKRFFPLEDDARIIVVSPILSPTGLMCHHCAHGQQRGQPPAQLLPGQDVNRQATEFGGAFQAGSGIGILIPLDDEVEQNPKHGTMDRAGEIVRKLEPDLIIGLGGGSVLDAAKAIALLGTNSGNLEDYEGLAKYRVPPLPVLAIPTTFIIPVSS